MIASGAAAGTEWCPDLLNLGRAEWNWRVVRSGDTAAIRSGLRGFAGSDVWGDTAYRSRANERLLAENGRRSRIHRKKPPRKPMPNHTTRANGAKSKVRAAVEHVFAHEKGPMGLVVRMIGLARARVKIGLANLVYNRKRTIWLHRASRPGIGG